MDILKFNIFMRIFLFNNKFSNLVNKILNLFTKFWILFMNKFNFYNNLNNIFYKSMKNFIKFIATLSLLVGALVLLTSSN